MKKLIAILMLCAMPCLVFAPPVGQTSEWEIVISPCAWCGVTNNLEVHHVWPQHLYPERMYDTNNMVCLCRGKDGKGCHYYIGHHAKGWDFVFTNVLEFIKMGGNESKLLNVPQGITTNTIKN